MNRVVITGLGIVSPLGNTPAAVDQALRGGKVAIGPLTQVATDALIVKIGAEVKAFDPTALFGDKQLPLLDRCSQFALAAARQAVDGSGLELRPLGAKAATIIGAGVGGITTLDECFHRVYAEGAKRLHPFTVPKLMISAPMSHISMEFGITGPSFTVASACASANHAIGVAYQMVKGGAITAAVTGGTEAVLTFGTLKGWEALRVMSPEMCRPFSKNRSGMVLGEGAAIFVIENRDHAMARGAPILAEIAGFGMSSDASDIVLPKAEGAAAAMTACLEETGLKPEAVEYINAHGTGTPANDPTETKAIRSVFGAHADKLAVSSTKSMHGHALGAAGALELAATVIAMRGGFIPPTANFTEPDPACDLDYVPNTARETPFEVALSNSFAFGGHNAVLAVKRA
jgi:nodulation protein E